MADVDCEALEALKDLHSLAVDGDGVMDWGQEQPGLDVLETK